MSTMAMEMVLRRMKIQGATVHGFRSSFRDWAGECTEFPRELAEAALAHTVGDAVERAYRRGDALERRRELMEAWARFCEAKDVDNVIRVKIAASSLSKTASTAARATALGNGPTRRVSKSKPPGERRGQR